MSIGTKMVNRQRINELADAFEDIWLAGQRPEMVEFFDKELDAPSQAELIRALVELEYHYCKLKSLPFDIDRVVSEFQEHAELIATVVKSEAEQSTVSETNTGLDLDIGTLSMSDADGFADQIPVEGAGLRPGQSFGRYEILSILGQGAMGSVYLAQDSTLNRKVALKIPRFTGDSPVAKERFFREAKSAAAIQHPNVCPVFDVGVENGQYFISMAYIPGSSLSEYLQQNGLLDMEEVVNIIRKLALALDESHQQGVLHRDLKPANVMMSLRGEPIVTDFGLARHVSASHASQLTQSGMLLGSPAYMSPEQIEAPGEVGPASDVYSLGIMMYQLLTGELPFRGDILAVISKIAKELPARPSSVRASIPPQLEAICLKAIEKDPASRFASMRDFAEALNAYARSTSVAHTGADETSRPETVATFGNTWNGSFWRYGAWLSLVGFSAFLLWLGTVFWVPAKNGWIRVEILDPSVEVVVSKQGVTIRGEEESQPISVQAGVEQNLKIVRGDFAFETESFSLKKGEETRIKIDFLNGELVATRDGKAWQVRQVDDELSGENSVQAASAANDPNMQSLTADESLASEPVNTAPSGEPWFTDEALTEQQAGHLDRLLNQGVCLRIDQSNQLPRPVRNKVAKIWCIDTAEYPNLGDEDLALLLEVVKSGGRLILATDQLTAKSWELLSQKYFPELMVFGDSLPAEAGPHIESMTNLQELELRYAKMQDSDLEFVGQLKNLRYLGLMWTPINGACFKAFENLQRLESLDLTDSNVEDQYLPELAKLQALRILGLSQTGINGSGLKSLAQLTSLNLRGCSGVADLSILSGWKMLTDADFVGTSVTNFEPLRNLPLVQLSLDYEAARDHEALSAISTLETINGQPASQLLAD
ncbi:MAG: protein kinase [bacterium]|nr:protein kinase [bacterium]